MNIFMKTYPLQIYFCHNAAEDFSIYVKVLCLPADFFPSALPYQTTHEHIYLLPHPAQPCRLSYPVPEMYFCISVAVHFYCYVQSAFLSLCSIRR